MQAISESRRSVEVEFLFEFFNFAAGKGRGGEGGVGKRGHGE